MSYFVMLAVALCSVYVPMLDCSGCRRWRVPALCAQLKMLMWGPRPCHLRAMAAGALTREPAAPQALSSRHRVQQRRQAELQQHLAQQDAAAQAAQARPHFSLAHDAARNSCCMKNGRSHTRRMGVCGRDLVSYAGSFTRHLTAPVEGLLTLKYSFVHA